jgi:basic membrane protein A
MQRLLLVALTAGALAALTMSVSAAVASGRSYRVGLIISIDTPTSADGVLHSSFLKAAAQVGVQSRVVELAPRSDPTGALLSLARQKYDLVVTGYQVDPAIVGGVAAQFPQTHFWTQVGAYADFGRKLQNVEGTVYLNQQASYLAGIVAARMEERRTGRHAISSVGGYAAVPDVQALIAGYEAGARHADARIKTLNGYAGSFNDTSKCHSVAVSQIAAGSGVVFEVAGACGLGALQAAKQKGVWGIGVDEDKSYLGSFVLTSVVTQNEQPLSREFQALRQGRLPTGGNILLDLRNGGVGLGKFSPEVPRSIVREVDRVRAQIVAGKIRVPSKIS